MRVVGKTGAAHVKIAVITVVIALVALFFVFDGISKLSERCKTETLKVCKELSGLTLPMFIILLIVGGLILVISTVVYILLSA